MHRTPNGLKLVTIGSYSLTLGTHAQEGYGTCLVCVCLSVCVYSSANIARFYTQNEVQYVGVYFRLFNVWIFDKSFRSKVMARKSQYANEQLPLATGYSLFRVPCIHQ